MGAFFSLSVFDILLPTGLDELPDHDPNQDKQVDRKVEANQIGVIASILISEDRIWYIIREQKEKPGAKQDDNFIEDLNEIVYRIFHGPHADVVC